MAWGSNKLHFTYDSLGPASVTYNGNRYFYLKTDSTMAATLGAANPLRYRGYVYDTETGFYYLSSRYYNPTWGRFINADTADVLGASPDKANWDKNLFAYCDNNPISRKDDGGEFWEDVTALGDSIFRSALIFGGIAIGAAALSAFVVGTGGAGAIAIAAAIGTIAEASMYTAAIGAFIGTMTVVVGEIGTELEMSKGHQGNMRDSGLAGLSDADIQVKIKDPQTKGKEKRRLQREEKARRNRNVTKRSGYLRTK